MQNKTVLFLTLDEVLEMHKLLIIRFGGKSGIRDMGLLESSLYRPKTGYYNGIAEMSAALFESLIMNHPFIDGNKRVAFFATDVFLRLNGSKFQVKPEEAHQFLIGLLEASECSYENLLPWIRRSIVTVS